MDDSFDRVADAVQVLAPSRLHLGFVDVSGDAGRRFGSLGLTIDDWSTRLSLSGGGEHEARAGQRVTRVVCNDADVALRIENYLQVLESQLQRRFDVRVHCHQPAPAHAGFGTGTQLALALSAALRMHQRLQPGVRELARLLDRGRRSGIGLGAFETGGFLVDGGQPTPVTGAPPIISRLPVPAHWRVLLLLDESRTGLHGREEKEAFARLPAFPVDEAHRLAHQVLLGVLPALVERDLDAFGLAIGDLQRTVGDYFAPAQGGRFASPAVTRALHWLQAQGVHAVGQSSWGPTGFAIVGSEEQAQSIASALRASAFDADGCRIAVARVRNEGAMTQWIRRSSDSVEEKLK